MRRVTSCFLLVVFVMSFVLPALATADQLPLKPPKHGGVYVVAHRGAHEGIPENTLAAYQKAIDIGVDFVEIDVRTTKDGKFVSIHNSKVDGYAEGVKGKVSELTLDALRALDIGGRVGPEWKGTKIPTFEEILDLCKGKVGIYLDLKDAPIEKLVPLIRERGMEHDVIWYLSPDEVAPLRAACPECIEMPDPGPEPELPALLEKAKPRVVASSWDVYSKSYVDKCHAAGAIVIVDESTPDCWDKCLEWGTDGIQTDHPEKLVKFLDARSQSKTK
jgi:glycerophosphoryl diester phosphodiesterase